MYSFTNIPPAYEIPYSVLMKDGSPTTKLTKAANSNANAQTWTTSLWVNRPDTGIAISLMYNYVSIRNHFILRFRSSGELSLLINNQEKMRTADTFLGTTDWLNIVLAIDTRKLFPHDQMKVYVNGAAQDYSLLAAIDQEYHTQWSKSGTDIFGDPAVGNQYITNIHHINGKQVLPSKFGRTIDSVWQPVIYRGTYSSNDYWLDFFSASDIGADASGNGNDWTYVPGSDPGDITTTSPTNP